MREAALGVDHADGVIARMRASTRVMGAWEALAIRSGAVIVSLVLFGIFVGLAGADPVGVLYEMYRGAFGSWFSLQNALLRAAPLMLTALATALPARLGLVIIGGEGAVAVGGLAAAATALLFRPASPPVILAAMSIVALVAGGAWIAAAGALRVYRGVNETISSLLLSYIAIALLNHLVEGPLRDPASLNKPSTAHIGAENMLPNIVGLDVHWGLVFGIVACAFCYVLMQHTVYGFGASIVGGNVRAALLSGLPVKKMTVLACFLGGGAAGVAGMVEVAAVHGKANASLVAGYGYTGILVAFLARHHPLAIMPVALLLGGIGASGGLLQRVHHLPDAAVLVLQGILFIVILASESLYSRYAVFQPLARPRDTTLSVEGVTAEATVGT
ncbi:MAG TPA: ABC transporter permease [Polyangiaceae bacterium]|nr:ABC transporter permease [Polyangiaceae bacterium]